jgi:hypothetical protein
VIGVHVDVAAAHDGDDMSASEAVAVFEDGGDAERGRRLDNKAGVVQEHPHAGDDRRLGDQDGVVGDQEEVVQDGRDGVPAGDAVGDGVCRAGGDDAPLPPGQCHGRRAGRLDADHLDAGGQRFQHLPDSGGHRPAAEGDQDGVERRPGLCQFQADKAYSPRANRAYLRERGIFAVIPVKADQAANRRKKGSRRCLRGCAGIRACGGHAGGPMLYSTYWLFNDLVEE